MQRRMIEIGKRELAREDERVGFVVAEAERRGEDQPRRREGDDQREREARRGWRRASSFAGAKRHEAARAFAPSTPGMKASKAAKNWSRNTSRSINNSCRAPSMTTSRPARRREAKRSVARVSVDAVGAGGDDQGRGQRAAGEIGVLEFAHQPIGGVEPADGRMAEPELGVGRERCAPCAHSARDRR